MPMPAAAHSLRALLEPSGTKRSGKSSSSTTTAER